MLDEREATPWVEVPQLDQPGFLVRFRIGGGVLVEVQWKDPENGAWVSVAYLPIEAVKSALSEALNTPVR